eukprot:CAMPEP_0178381264 /NCGR_PEP_ID=MMETSP0689_2-20121128/5891_1 /TAXON_ID=160604 /ORGANISM="Amphidinium massartii, Strain CS-259" /LENGTH=292 /DNA_ID=CAMNT_0020001437 /DNA_START=57 /DNA_END=935 /DNA_ORIENTATION=-
MAGLRASSALHLQRWRFRVAGQTAGRVAFDDFQKKWDRFDRDDYIEALAAGGGKLTGTAADSAGSGSGSGGLATMRGDDFPSAMQMIAPSSGIRTFRILLAGERGAGKTSLVIRHLNGEFGARTSRALETEAWKLFFSTNCGELCFSILEISQDIPTGFYSDGIARSADALLLMYDATVPQFVNISNSWPSHVEQAFGSLPVVVVGSKAEEQNSNHPMRSLRFPSHWQHYFVSNKTQMQCESPFLWLCRRLVNQPELHFVPQPAPMPRPVLIGPRDYGKELENWGRAREEQL